jgi:mannitol/fructose-specific phosphotransferase system IIA component (Ntr-type)
MNITDVLQKHCICVPLRSTDKTAAITELVDVLDDKCGVTDRDAVLAAVLAREKTRSTGIGLGLAVPHGKSHGCRGLTIAVGKPESPMPFDAVDGRSCQLIVLLASPVDETGPHIQALASISRLWKNDAFRRAATEANTPDELYAAIERHQC